MRISDWSSDVCSSDLGIVGVAVPRTEQRQTVGLVETQADRRFGHLVDVAHQRAVDDIFVVRGGQATRRRAGREDGIVVNEIALAFEKPRLMLPARVEVAPAIVADRGEGGFEFVLELTPLRRAARLRLERNLAAIGLEHEIHDENGRASCWERGWQ